VNVVVAPPLPTGSIRPDGKRVTWTSGTVMTSTTTFAVELPPARLAVSV